MSSSGINMSCQYCARICICVPQMWLCGIGWKLDFYSKYLLHLFIVCVHLTEFGPFTWFSIDLVQDFMGVQAHNQLLWLRMVEFCNLISIRLLWRFQFESILETSTQHQTHCILNAVMESCTYILSVFILDKYLPIE